jgi:phage shock protein PspC (stress-responsive transcriptional regulator)
MKKIININLSGRVIPIEDSAYEKLQAYIESLRRYFANEEGRDEIINDIEGRIAELMNEKIRMGAAAISDADINEIIASMGTIEDFEAADKENAETSSAQPQGNNTSYTYTGSKPRGRLYRDSNDKIIGGVCSGIANYTNVDPVVVRLVFAILGFATGLGILTYIILWIILPTKDLDGYVGRRMYRNPDNKVIGGVAGGLAAYFNKSVSAIRLIFAAPLLLNILINMLNGFRWHYDFNFFLNIGFGSLTGTFILTYIILWIVLPEAGSDYQKMEMRGETVDVKRIRQNVKEGMQNMKGKMKEWGQEIKESAEGFSNKAKEFAQTSGKTIAAEVRDTTKRTGNGLGHIIGVLFKAFFLFIAGCIAFGLFVAFIALIFGGVAWWPVNNFLWTSKWQHLYAWGTLIFFLGVPLIGLIVWIIRRVIRVRSRNNYLGWTFGGLWLLGWICAILFASSISNDFRVWKNDGGTELTLIQPANGKMIVAVTEPELAQTGNMWWMDDENRGWDLSSDTLKLSTIKIDDVQPSLDANYHVIIKKYSYGRTAEEALDRATSIQYKAVSKDSILDLGSGYAVSKDKKFRFQQVHVEIQVPVGKMIRFDESVTDKLSQVNFKIKRKRKRGIGVVIEDENDWNRHFGYETGVDYTMGADRKLHGPDGKAAGEENINRQEHNKGNAPERDYKKQIEELKKKRQEDSIKIKELEESQKMNTTGVFHTRKERNEDEGLSFGPSPGASVLQF